MPTRKIHSPAWFPQGCTRGNVPARGPVTLAGRLLSCTGAAFAVGMQEGKGLGRLQRVPQPFETQGFLIVTS
jgi:hypothetical protein